MAAQKDDVLRQTTSASHTPSVRQTASVRQTTLGQRVTLQGIGVHSGAPVVLSLNPASADKGVIFRRSGLPEGESRDIHARRECVGATELCTVIAEPGGASVSTIEHLMAALAAMNVDNVLVEIDGPEVPIMDGSSAAFVAAIDEAGVVELLPQRRSIRVIKPVRIEMGRAWAEFLPATSGFTLDVEIDFPTPLIGRQRRVFALSPEGFRNEIARARTFGFMKDVEFLWKKNLALGASLENTVALGEDRIINPEGTRYPDEFVRHKILDAIGDLSLSGQRIEGLYRAYCPGHKVNALVLEALLADRSAYVLTDEVPVRPAASPVRSKVVAPRGEALWPVAAYAASKN
jgi:UDP-3-O-[3-hydroxymyristoyl] N-acetylglucosamine deacetylase